VRSRPPSSEYNHIRGKTSFITFRFPLGFQQGRFADAVVALQQVSDQLQAFRSVLSSNPQLASLHGISLGFLASSLRELKRPGEALSRS
jgi:hypothetical protein